MPRGECALGNFKGPPPPAPIALASAVGGDGGGEGDDNDGGGGGDGGDSGITVGGRDIGHGLTTQADALIVTVSVAMQHGRKR